MEITSRGHLIKVINDWGIESELTENTTSAKLLNTVVYNKYKDKFYRVTWGEVADNEGVYHLWYKEKAPEVFYNESSEPEEWLTKQEMKDIDMKEQKRGEHLNVDDYLLFNVENNLVSMEESGDIWAKVGEGKPWYSGKGKSLYSIKKVIRELKEDKSVLFLSPEKTEEEVLQYIADMLLNTEMLSEITEQEFKSEVDKLRFIDEFISKAKLTVDTSFTLDDNYIVRKMREKAKSKEGLDYVVIDSISLDPNNHKISYQKRLKEIEDLLENVSNEINCSVLVSYYPISRLN